MDRDGRQLFDAKGETIGVIVGAGYERKKFGTEWLVIETVSGRRTLVPADRIGESGERLVLPYPRGYVDTGPVLGGRRSSDPRGRAASAPALGHRRRRTQQQCMTGCGLCMANRRLEHRR